MKVGFLSQPDFLSGHLFMQLRKALYPFSLLYGLITDIRNKCFDWQLLHSEQYNQAIISIGNITVGGTGKTPLTEFCIRLLKADYKLALLSRGYKRKTQGVVLANTNSTAALIGDEPYQVLSKFPEIEVVVAEKRVDGIAKIQKDTEAEVILMDDAYQHRYVQAGLSILVIDYNRPLWDDLPFPAGDLRERAKGQKRADVILVNKCPGDMSILDKQKWLDRINPLKEQSVFFSAVNYGKFVCKDENIISNKSSVIALTGIARPEPFINYLNERFNVKKHFTFPDHHHFSATDITSIKSAMDELGENGLIITTEKDYTRLNGMNIEFMERMLYIPIELRILFNEETTLVKIIRNYVRDHQTNS